MALRAADANGSLPNTAIVERDQLRVRERRRHRQRQLRRQRGQHDASATRSSRRRARTRSSSSRPATTAGTSTATRASNDQAYPCEFHRPPGEGGASAANILCVGATDRERRDRELLQPRHLGGAHRRARRRHPAAPRRGTPTVVFGQLRGHRRAVQRPLGQPDAEPEPLEPDERDADERHVQHHRLARSASTSVNQDTSISKLAPFSLAGRTGCRDRLQHAARHGQLRSAPRRDDVLLDHRRRRALSAAGPGSTSGDWFALQRRLLHQRRRWRASRSASGSTSTATAIVGDGGYIDDLVVDCLLHNGNCVPVPRRHLDGDAARRRRRGTAPGGQPVPDGRPAQERHPRGRRHAGRARDAHPGRPPPQRGEGARHRPRRLEAEHDDHGRAAQPDDRSHCDVQVHVLAGRVEVRVQAHDRAVDGCTSPRTYRSLAFGLHTFRVRAIDPSGNIDATPAVRTWRINRP